MTVYRLIAPEWLARTKVLEGEFSDEKLHALNLDGYNCYLLPNYPSSYDPNQTVDGSHIDTFDYVYLDMDLKHGQWDKHTFITQLQNSPLKPTLIIDSGHGIHAYWKMNDLDAMSFLRLQRRLCRAFNSDPAVCKIFQLMRVPGTYNTKKSSDPSSWPLCDAIAEHDLEYSCEQLDQWLPKITKEDEDYCKAHHDKTYNLTQPLDNVDEKLPLKFLHLVRDSKEVNDIWKGNTDDRSKDDYRLGHIMFAHGFSKQEAASVLINAPKALSRAPKHRLAYAQNIIDKIWTFELSEDKTALNLSMTVREILSRAGDGIKGTRFPCHKYLDNTSHGFRLGQVIGLVAGSGVGKTAMALNMFMGFVQNNPDYDHFFIPLEQPGTEIADRWKTMCGSNTHLHDKVHVISNYDDDGGFRHLSFNDIKTYLLKFQEVTGRKVGCVVIDHIGALKKKGKDGENQDLMDICHSMKAFAVETNTLLVMQSQAPREKAGIGDLEINKDAAYGTVYFESYCDYLVTIWQPLKRCYSETECPTVTAYKFCKIRHKKKHLDLIQEDVRYMLLFDPEHEKMRELTQAEEAAFDFFNKKATNIRGQDRKTDVMSYVSARWEDSGKTNHN